MPLFHVTPVRLDDDQVVRVRDPATTQLVPPQGVAVEWSAYWQKRLEDAEVTKSDPPAPEDEGQEQPPIPPAKDARPRRSHQAPAVLAEKED